MDSPPSRPEIALKPQRGPMRLWLLVLLVVVALSALAVSGLLWERSGPGPRATTVIDQFWAPALAGSRPVLLCVAQPLVYNLTGPTGEAVQRLGRRTGSGHARESRVLADLRDIVPTSDRYFALGDAVCLSEMTAFLARRGREYRIRGAGATTPDEVRAGTAVLIGGFPSDWVARVAGQLRFTFSGSAEQGTRYVRDSTRPGDRRWTLKEPWPAVNVPLDYAIVSRVIDPLTRNVFVFAMGMTPYATAAAGQFLTNPELLSQVFEGAPAQWQNRKLQVVLSTKINGGVAATPQVLAMAVE